MSKEFLKNYINAYSPVAQEWEGQKIWAEYIKPYVHELHSDNYGNIYGLIKGEQGDIPEDKRYKVGIQAHADEIAFIITYIDGDGLVYVAKHGGSDAAIAPSKKVVIHTRKNGKIPGVFGFPAIHVRKTLDEKAPKMENLFIDLGYDKKSVNELGVEVGNLVTFEETYAELGNYYCGKSLDNKIGGFIISQVSKKLKENNIKLPFDLYIINTVMEETGLLGSSLVAQQLKLDLCLVHDVCHETTSPGYSKIKNSNIIGGNGSVLEYSTQNHRLVLDFIREIADKNKIKYQIEPGSTGNDTMSFFKAGSATAIIASPCKYMHSTCEMVHKKDVKTTIELFYQCLINLTPRSWKYYNF